MPEQKQVTIVLGIVVNNFGQILMPKRNQPGSPQVHGKWEFPGGGIEFGEEPEIALLREVKEETGLDVEIVRLLPKVYSNTWDFGEGQKQVLLLAYECKVVGGELATSDDEIGELKYFNLNDVDYSNSMPKTKEIIELLKTK